MAVLADGSIVIATQVGTIGNILVHGVRLSRDGHPVGDPVVLSDGPAHGDTNIDIAPLSKGGFVVGWTLFKDDFYPRARRFGTDLTPTGEGFPLDPFDGHAGNAALAPLPKGRFVAAWIASEGNGKAVYARILP
jgi:hypothetical protein